MATLDEYQLDGAAANADGYRSKKRNIPFYSVEDKRIKVKLLYPEFSATNPFAAALPSIRTRAVNRLTLHYFPEYYLYYRTFTRKKEAAFPENSPLEMAYRRLRESMSQGITANHYRPHDPHLRKDKDIVLASFSGFGFELARPEVEALKLKVGPSNPIYQKVQRFRLPSEYETITFVTRSPKEIKAVLAALELLPDLDGLRNSLLLFNGDEGITAATAHTTLQVGSLMRDNALAQDGLASYQEQLNGFEGSLPINLNFNDMERGMMQILNGVVVEGIVKELTDVHEPSGLVSGPYIEFGEADTITLGFGIKDGDAAISSISYLVRAASQNQQPLRTGYMTNVLYNKEFNDPLILATLKGYEKLVAAMALARRLGGTPSSFMDFLKDNPEGFGAGENFVWDDLAAPPKPQPTDHIYLREAHRLGIIDLGDTENLDEAFFDTMDPETLARFKAEVRDNPEVYARVRASIKNKTLGTSADILGEITKVLESGGPLMMGGVKANSPLGALLRKIGIQELAKEAWICATFGLAPAFARVSGAGTKAINKVRSQQGFPIPEAPRGRLGPPVKLKKRTGKPKPPKPSITIPKPPPPAKLKLKTIDGDLWNKILKVMVDTLMQGVLEIIKALAKLLKESCKLNNPRSDDYGANDVGDLVNDNLNDDFLNLPSISNDSPLDHLFANDGLTPAQVLGGGSSYGDRGAGYLSDLSAILSSMDICFLFTNRSELSEATMDKIINFNLSYHDLGIRAALNTPSAIGGFFANLARFVDVSAFCNEIANELYQANIDNICLLEEEIPDRLTDLLQDIAENGIDVADPAEEIQSRLDCPERDDFINNPLMNTSIPILLNTVADIVEREFINGVSAAQQILKEPTVSQTDSSRVVSESINAAQRSGLVVADDDPAEEPASKVSQDILKGVAKAFEGMDSLFDRLNEICDVPSILGVEADAAEDALQVIIDVIREMLSDPGFVTGIQEIENRITEISGAFNQPGGASSVATQYEFPVRFKERFEDYLAESPTFKPIASMGISDFDTFRTTGHVKSKYFNAYSNYSDYTSYKPINIKFTLPRQDPPRLEVDPHKPPYGEIGGITIPRFRKVKEAGQHPGDHLLVTFPTADDATKGGAFANITLKSQLIPGTSEDNGFTMEDPVPLVANSRDTNPYVSLFSDTLINQIKFGGNFAAILNADPQTKKRYTREIDTVFFPAAFAGQVEGMFNFIQSNGIFDTERLNSLNFFYNNAGCLPEDAADLLDMGPSPAGTPAKGRNSILDLVNDELLGAMCNDKAAADDGNPTGTQIRDVLRFAVFQMFIQIHIAQFIIKNIFVFSAFEIDELLEIPTIKRFMSVTIRNQIMKLIKTKPLVGEKLVEYYNKKLRRPNISMQGGLLDSDGNIVLSAERALGLTDIPLLIEYLVQDRITRSRKSVSNAVKRCSNLTNPKSFDRAFIEDVVTVQPSFLGAGPAGSGASTVGGTGYIWARHNPKHAPANEPMGGYSTKAGSNRIKYLDIAREKFEFDDPVAKTLRYGKLVLERQVVWERVETEDGKPVPNMLRYTSGHGYGLELSIFRAVMFDSALRTRAFGTNTSRKLKFTNLAMQYNIVYYMPDDRTGGVPSGQLFFEDNPLSKSKRMLLGSNGIVLNRFVLARLNGTLPLATEISTTETALQNRWSTTTGTWQSISVPVLETQIADRPLGYGSTVTNSELALITQDPVFQDYFDKTFNRSITNLVPIMYNFYLTTESFPAMDGILMGAKLRCLDIFYDSVLNDDPSVQGPPAYTSPQAEAAAAAGDDEFLDTVSPSARDFILKMLIETPINILRGVSEMMDPHVGISNLIRKITAAIFLELSKAIDKSEPIRFLREGPKSQAQLDAEEAERAAATEPAPAQAPTDAAPNAPAQANGLPAGAQLYRLELSPGKYDEKYEYGRLPQEPPGSPAIWFTRGIPCDPNTPWINLSEPEPNEVAIHRLETHGKSEFISRFPSAPRQAQGVVEYTLSKSGRVRTYQYAKNSDGEWLTRETRAAASTPWSEARNLTREGNTLAIQILEEGVTGRGGPATPVNPPPAADPATPDLDPATPDLDPTDIHQSIQEEQAALAAEDTAAAVLAAAAAEIAALPIDTVLQNGSQGEAVFILQAKLEQLGYTLEQYGVDGIFGTETETHVEEFQSDKGITIDGIVAPETWGAIVNALEALAEAEANIAPTPGVGPFPDITGEKVMELMFCALAIAMEIATQGFILGDGANAGDGGKDRRGVDTDTRGRLPAPDSGFFLGTEGLRVPGAVFLGNRPKPDANGVSRPFWEPGMGITDLTYQEGQEDPRDPRNNVPEAIRDNLFPRIDMDGVDFTGTFLGLLMLPPGPFGIVYLLLMLIKNALEDALKSDESDESGDPMSNVSGEESASEC